jgi:hypothetical protein
MQDADPLFHADRFRDREDKIPRVLGAESADEQQPPKRSAKESRSLPYGAPSLGVS